MIQLKLTDEEFLLVRLAVAKEMETLALQDMTATTSLILKIVETLKVTNREISGQ